MKLKLILLNLLALTTFISLSNNVYASKKDSTDNLSIEEKRDNHLSSKIKKINYALNKKIYDFREHPQKQNNTEENSWMTYVKNINYLKNNQLEIYVNSNFKKLNDKKREIIIATVQRISLSEVLNVLDISSNDYMEGLSSIIYLDGNRLGRSVFLNTKELKWYD
ncbi:hypothetical protein OF389_07150 [Companilactobacillus farciminis]|nr:hypothetical protein [Companilactobacillus farciminis]